MGRIVLIAAKEDSATRMIVEGGGGVKVELGTRYILKTAAGNALVDPVTVKRSGKDLLVFLEDDKTPELTLQGYFDPGMNAQLYGIADDSQLRAYAPVDTSAFNGHLMLQDGESTAVEMAGPVLADMPVITASQDYSIGLIGWPVLVGVGALGVLAASQHSSGGSGHSEHKAVEAPQVTITRLVNDQSPLQGDIQPGTGTHDTRPEIIGTGTVSAVINIYDSNILLGSTTVQADGTWSFTPTQDLAFESHSITATAADAAGHASQPTAAFVVTIVPEPDVQQQYWLSSMTGPVPDGGMTADEAPTLTGKTKPNSTVMLYDNGHELGSAASDSDGLWSYALTNPLSAGSHTFNANVITSPGEPPIHAQASYSLTIDSASDQPADTSTAEENNTLNLSLADVLAHDLGDIPWHDSTSAQQGAESSDRADKAAISYGSSSAWLVSHENPELLIQ